MLKLKNMKGESAIISSSLLFMFEERLLINKSQH